EAVREPASHGLMEATVAPSGGGTQAGSVFGSPGYMSPEQARGESTDARSDFFSFGAVLYEMLSGERAFPGDLAESSQAILRGQPPELCPDVPEPLAQVVRRCLEKDPARRFHSASDLAFHLESMRSASARRQEERTGRGRRWRLALLGALLVAVPALFLL